MVSCVLRLLLSLCECVPNSLSDHLEFCYHTGELKGVCEDAFDIDIIVNEWKRMEQRVEKEADKSNDDNENDATVTNEAEQESTPEEELQGRHYLVMRFQTWSGEGQSINFNAAKYCLKSPNNCCHPDYLRILCHGICL